MLLVLLARITKHNISVTEKSAKHNYMLGYKFVSPPRFFLENISNGGNLILQIIQVILLTLYDFLFRRELKRGRSMVCLGFAFPAGGQLARSLKIQIPKPILSRSNSLEAVNTKHEAISTKRSTRSVKHNSKAWINARSKASSKNFNSSMLFKENRKFAA